MNKPFIKCLDHGKRAFVINEVFQRVKFEENRINQENENNKT